MEAVRRIPEQESMPAASLEASISAWVDGQEDIRPEDLDTPYGRQVWDTYHLIGDVMRNDSLSIRPSDFFYARLSKAIDAEPAIVAPTRWYRRPVALRAGLSGLAVAAAVASVAWVALPYFSGPDAVPAGAAPVLATAVEDAGLRDYLEAHREITGAGSVHRAAFELSRP